MGISAESRATSYASFGFDCHMMDVYPTLIAGAQLHVISDDLHLDLPGIDKYCNEHGITNVFMTTQVGRQFAGLTTSKTLKTLTVAGEALVPTKPPVGTALWNGYGPTECTILATAYQVTEEAAFVPIGRAVSNTECYIVDEEGRLLPVGVPGELWLSGPSVARGYLNRPDKTKEVFIKNPFNHDPKYEHMYRTGDIVRWMTDGQIQFIGRKDSQVKVRGFRIELTEVEGMIRKFPGIKDATVAAFDDPAGGKYIAAYVVSDDQVDIDALNAFILSEKPPYMVPAVTMQIDRIPLNQNQKVNKRALPKPEMQKKENEQIHLTLSEREKEIQGIVGEVLGNAELPVTESLGSYGLTSISSITLGVKLYKRYNLQLDSRNLPQMSILDIERGLLELLLEEHLNGGMKLKEIESVQSAPLTAAQLGMYLECLKNPTSYQYTIPDIIELPGDVSEDEVTKALAAIVENHPAFHLVFENGENGPVQRLDRKPFAVPVLNMTEEAFDHYKMTCIRPFDLSKGPLYRFELIRVDGHLYLFMHLHHLITDGGSVDLLLNELVERIEGREVEAEKLSYLDFASEQKKLEDSAEYKESKEFFDKVLEGCEGASRIPAELPKDENQIHAEGMVSAKADLKQAAALAQKIGVTPMGVFLSALYYTISRYINDPTVSLGTISNGRSRLELYNTMGMFVNTLAISGTYDQENVTEYIQKNAENFASTLRHEEYPFAKVAADHGFDPHIMFAYQVGVLVENRLHGQTIKHLPLTLDLSKFDLSVSITGDENNCEVVVEYDCALYSKTFAENFAASIAATAKQLCENPEEKIRHISIMSEAQKALVNSFHVEKTGPVENKFFYEPLQRFAKEDPERTALIACDRTLTYGELNTEANRIAHALMERGIKRGDRVVVLLPRRSYAISCIYGISKTGATFIPCDPAYPADRISLILEDSGAPYVVTTTEHLAEHEGKAINIEELLSYGENNAEGAASKDIFEDPNVPADTSDLAYMLYTSGSTGRPKGVKLRHVGICNYLQDEPTNRYVYAWAHEGHRVLCITSLSFDMSMGEYGLAIFHGLSVVLANEDEMNNPVELARLFKETGADLLDSVPSRLQSYMELPDFADAMGQVKAVVCGGEPFSEKLLDKLREHMTGHIFNIYGPTEITVANSGTDIAHTSKIHTGRPLYNYSGYVVDPDGNELPAGVVGELYIGGVGVSAGYNNLEEQTKEKFITYQGEKVYRSGDYANWDEQGNIVIHGRLDNQIKLRGLRIELGEVEAAITAYPSVTKAVVVVKTIAGKEHLAAYFTATTKVDVLELKESAAKILTPYMVPTAYAQLDHFDKTPNGKTDLKKLPEPTLTTGGGEYVAPVTKQEKFFCEVFEEILGLDQVSADASFFDLGGTSLTVTQVIVKAQEEGYDIPYAEVFNHKSAKELAAFVGGAEPEEELQNTEDLENYDYSEIEKVLEQNKLENFLRGEKHELEDVVLTGATGYLGIHVLHELIMGHMKAHPNAKVYAIARGRKGISARRRLEEYLFYYFEMIYQPLMEKNLIVIDGDVTDPKVFDQIKEMAEDPSKITVINCAAMVKHFSEGTEIEDVNIGGLQNCVDFCLETGARLMQTSTISVDGISVNNTPDAQTLFSEQMLYFGQSLENKYARSKFIAERIVLESIATKGLKGKIARLGNLAPRLDGEFQINYRTNSFMSQLHAIQMMGCYGYAQESAIGEFSPIELTARALLLLATTPDECTVFHNFNNNTMYMATIVRYMSEALEQPIEEVEDSVFEEKLREALNDPSKAAILQSVVAYRGKKGETIGMFTPSFAFTTAILTRLGFHWPVISKDYVERFAKALDTLGFFENRR